MAIKPSPNDQMSSSEDLEKWNCQFLWGHNSSTFLFVHYLIEF